MTPPESFAERLDDSLQILASNMWLHGKKLQRGNKEVEVTEAKAAILQAVQELVRTSKPELMSTAGNGYAIYNEALKVYESNLLDGLGGGDE